MTEEVRLTSLTKSLHEQIKEVIPIPADIPAVFFFSMAKCGSTMLTNAVRSCVEELGIPSFHFARFFWDRGILKSKWSRHDLRPFVQDGIVYYGFRSLPEFLAQADLLQQRKSIFLVRDPRDAATSHYFSKLYEHPVPGNGRGPAAEKFLAEREKLEKTSIDTHVLQYSSIFLSTWSKYMESLPVSAGKTKIYRYEDIIFNKEDFFRDAFSFLEIDIPKNLLAKLTKQADIFPQEERKNKRVRIVTPGNHVEKLKATTIEQLNDNLRKPLSYHGYI